MISEYPEYLVLERIFSEGRRDYLKPPKRRVLKRFQERDQAMQFVDQTVCDCLAYHNALPDCGYYDAVYDRDGVDARVEYTEGRSFYPIAEYKVVVRR